MTDPTKQPIVVSSAQGLTDALQAVLRYIVVIVGFLSGLAGFLSHQDVIGAVTYVQTNLGSVVAAGFGLVGLLTAAYGIYKSWKRGAQIATVASSSSVPNNVAKIAN